MLVFLLLGLTSCAGRERPEGIVERWLLALNQGAAGDAGRYADPPTSRLILPGYAASDPGRLDIAEVGAAVRKQCSWDVPFRVVRVDGREIRGFAIIDTCPTASPKPIAAVELRDVPNGLFPSEGGPSVGTDRPAMWAIALAVGVGILFIGEGLMRLAGRTVIGSSASRVGTPGGGDHS